MQKEFDFKKLRQELSDIEIARQEIRTWIEDVEAPSTSSGQVSDTHEVIQVERSEVMSHREHSADEAARYAEIEAEILAHVTELDDDQLYTAYHEFFKLALFEEAMKRNLYWALPEYDEDDDINFVTYTITASNATSLDAIETLIRETCKLCGMPENIADGLSMNLPYSDVMKIMIGDDRFTGLIEYAECDASTLVLNCFCTWRCIRPFAEALKESFGVNVETSY